MTPGNQPTNPVKIEVIQASAHQAKTNDFPPPIPLERTRDTGLHHLSFEVGDIDEIELGASQLIQAGYKDAFGLGRHVGGSNYFHYIRDPWNSLAEYFWDIDVIPEDDACWEPLNVTPEQLTAVWPATPPPPEFAMNFEAL